VLVVHSIDTETVSELHYLNARSGGGSEVSRLPIVRAHANAFASDSLDAIVCCSDLQGVVSGRLLGVAVANHLAELADDGVLPPAARTGIVLAGDLYSVPAANKRGGFGGVATVWEEFASLFPWVVGVAGNHDDVTGIAELPGCHLLDGTAVVVDDIRFGGVGGIIGNPRKPGRRDEDDQLERIASLVDHCDMLVLHEGPDGGDGQPGNPSIRELLGPGLTVCGHTHWNDPLARHDRGQILNVDTRVVVLDARLSTAS